MHALADQCFSCSDMQLDSFSHIRALTVKQNVAVALNDKKKKYLPF